METSQTLITLASLPIGARLLIRSKKDWRTAVISKIADEKVLLIVCSPLGRTYRLSRKATAEIIFDGKIPLLKIDSDENWRENFSQYDIRW